MSVTGNACGNAMGDMSREPAPNSPEDRSAVTGEAEDLGEAPTLPPRNASNLPQSMPPDDSGSPKPLSVEAPGEQDSRPASTEKEPRTAATSEAAVPNDSPRRAGRFFLEHRIGSGGMGTVYRAHDPLFDRPLAIKVLHKSLTGQPEAESRFYEEAHITGQLQHPGVPPVHELGRLEDGRPFFAMKLIEGETLGALLRRRVDPTEELSHFLVVFEQVCQTIAYAHSKGIIHRDLKPDNVMVGAFGEVQVMDWGLAKRLGDEREETVSQFKSPPAPIDTGPEDGEATWVGEQKPDSPTQRPVEDGDRTHPGAVMGTPAYIPPEQARGAVDALDQRCDVFGLGAILCVILTGKPPYVADDSMDVLLKAVEGDIEEAYERLERCGADAELVAIAKRCLAPERDERFCDAGQVADAVAAYRSAVRKRLHDAEVHRAQAEVEARAERMRMRLTLGLVVSLGVLLLIAGGAVLWVQYLGIEAQRVVHQQEAQQTVRRLRAMYAVRESVRKIYELIDKGMFNEASFLLAQTMQRMADVHDGDLFSELEKANKNIDLAARIEDIRFRRAAQVLRLPEVRTDSEYENALIGTYRVFHEGEAPAAVAERIRQSPIRNTLLAALDDWADAAFDPARQRWLLEVARLSDSHPVRDRFRDPKTWEDVARLAKLAEKVDPDDLTPSLLVVVANRLGQRYWRIALRLLSNAQQMHPDDFWLNYHLALLLSRSQPDRAIEYYRAALARRPRSISVLNGMADCLMRLNRRDEAVQIVRSFETAMKENRGEFYAWAALGEIWSRLSRFADAEQAYRQALDQIPPEHQFRQIIEQRLRWCVQQRHGQNE